MPPNVHFFVDKPDLAGVKWHRNTGKLRFCPHMLYMQAEALFHRSSDLILLFCWKEWISLWWFRLKIFASALCSSTPFFCRFRMFLCRIAHEDLCWIRFWWAAPTRVIRTRRGRLFLFAFSTPCSVNRKPRRISFLQTMPFSTLYSEAAHRSVSPRANTECGTIIKNKGNR